MSLTGTSFEKKQKPLPPQGPQVAVCYLICDIGTHQKSYMNQPAEPTPLVHFGWELVNLPHQVFDEKKGAQPLALFQEYTVSLGDKAKLKKVLSAWRGVEPKDLAKELPAFLGQPCQINVEYKADKQRPDIMYANVGGNGTGIMRLMQGMNVNKLTNKPVFFNLDNYSHEAFLQLPEWIQKKIKSSLEWSGIVAKYGQPPQTQTTQQQQQQGGFNQTQQQNNQNQGFGQQTGFNQQPQNFGNNQPANNQQGFNQNQTPGIVTGNPFDQGPPF